MRYKCQYCGTKFKKSFLLHLLMGTDGDVCPDCQDAIDSIEEEEENEELKEQQEEYEKIKADRIKYFREN